MYWMNIQQFSNISAWIFANNAQVLVKVLNVLVNYTRMACPHDIPATERDPNF